MTKHLLTLLTALLLAPLAALQADEAPKRKPNVLFIAVDDMRCELGCYGAAHVQSPHMDRFAKSGVLFNRAYCQLAVCNPSRVSLLTGLRPDTTKVWDLVTEMRTVMPDVITLPQHFRRHGYRAVAYGKIFHNPFPDAASWDEPTHNAAGVIAYSEANRARLAAYREELRAAGKPRRAIERMRGPATEIQQQPDDRNFDGKQTSDALEKMRELATGESPFFLAVGYIRPHLPFITPKKYWDLYDRPTLPLAVNPQLPKDMPPVAFGDRNLGGFYELRDYMDYADAPSPFESPLTAAQQRELRHGYYASVSFIDAQVGRLLEGLDELGLSQNTIVVLWSDHGWKLGEHGGWCKQTNFEIDTRAPLMIRAPGAKANGSPSDALVEFVDVYPTLCELAGLPVPELLEGKSLAPLLDGSAAAVKDAAFSQFPRRHEGRDYMGYAMRTEHYRYVEWLNARSGEVAARELYDHANDAAENENIASRPEHATLIETLNGRMWKTLPRPKLPFPFAQAAAALPVGPRGASAQPNILFLMADDWSAPHVGFLGDPVVRTPALDRIAHDGVVFEHAFVSSPSCTPSRLAVATGQYHWQLGEGANLGGSIRKGVPVYPELLSKAGYAIGHARKGAAPSQHKFTQRDPFGPKFKSFAEFLTQRKSGEPFCFWYGAGEPHRPYRFGEGEAAGIDPAKVRLPPGLPDHEIVRRDFADYLHRVQRFDDDCAAMLSLLEESGEFDQTIIVVSGDNGLPFPRGKATLYDTGTHVPLAVRWPARVQGGQRVTDFVSLTDLAPTFLEAAGLDIPGEMTGRSLMPLLTADMSGQIDSERTFVVTGMDRHVYRYPCRALRTADFLYIHNYDPEKWPTGLPETPEPLLDFASGAWPTHKGAFSHNIDPGPAKQFLLAHRDDPAVRPFHDLACGPRPVEELYDLRSDPGQLRNVAADPEYAAVLIRLASQLTAELRNSNDPVTADESHQPKLETP